MKATPWAAVAIVVLDASLLLIVSPFLCLGGALGGSDSGYGVVYGLAVELGVPWAVYVAWTTIILGGLRRSYPLAALGVALCQLVAAIWFVRPLFRLF